MKNMKKKKLWGVLLSWGNVKTLIMSFKKVFICAPSRKPNPNSNKIDKTIIITLMYCSNSKNRSATLIHFHEAQKPMPNSENTWPNAE